MPQLVVAERRRLHATGDADHFADVFEAEIHTLARERVQHPRRVADEQHARRRLKAAGHELFEREAETLIDGVDRAEAPVARLFETRGEVPVIERHQLWPRPLRSATRRPTRNAARRAPATATARAVRRA